MQRINKDLGIVCDAIAIFELIPMPQPLPLLLPLPDQTGPRSGCGSGGGSCGDPKLSHHHWPSDHQILFIAALSTAQRELST